MEQHLSVHLKQHTMFSNSFVLTRFGKLLASRSDTTPTQRNNNDSNNHNNTNFEQVVIRPEQFTTRDLPPNAKLLPLVHTHNGQRCPISEANQLKVKTAQDLLTKTELSETTIITQLEKDLQSKGKDHFATLTTLDQNGRKVNGQLWDLANNQLDADRDDKLAALAVIRDNNKATMVTKWNQSQTQADSRKNAIKAKEAQLIAQKAKLSAGHDASLWEARHGEAESELNNVNGKLKAFRAAAESELNQLHQLNSDALRAKKNQIAIECSNLDKLCADRVREIKHNKAHTSIEVLHGVGTSLPLMTQQQVELPVIRPAMVQTSELFTIPAITQVPVTNNFYFVDGEAGPKYQHRPLNLQVVPEASGFITHSRSVPQLRVVRDETVVMKEQTIVKPVTETHMETVTKRVQVPGQVIHAPIQVEVPIVTNNVKTVKTTKTTPTTYISAPIVVDVGTTNNNVNQLTKTTTTTTTRNTT